MVIMPPFLTKILMENDSERAIALMIATCKALCDFNSVAVESEPEEEESEEATTMAKEILSTLLSFCTCWVKAT